MSDDILNALNTMNRHFWTLFNEMEKAIDRGDLEGAKMVCKQAKANLKELLKENSQS
jgi:hypothetical protein